MRNDLDIGHRPSTLVGYPHCSSLGISVNKVNNLPFWPNLEIRRDISK